MITVDAEHEARLLVVRTNAVTGWPTEVWCIHEAGNPGRSVDQVTLYRHEHAWHPWTGDCWRLEKKARRIALATRRNEARS